MGDVVAQQFLLDPAKRCPHCGSLRDHVETVAILGDHLGDAAHLALDPSEPLKTGLLGFFLHA
jgi:hypothetical protein